MSATPPPPGAPDAGPPQLSPADEKLWATLVQLGGILFTWIPALVGYLVLKDRGPFIREHTATALNFQITVFIAYFVSGLLVIVGIGVLIGFAVWILSIVFSIIAAVKANQGEYYTYPLAIRFVS